MNEVRLKVMEAIVSRRVISACYNGVVTLLAPHLLFERHGEFFMKALNLNKARRVEEPVALGQYKLSGLSALEMLEDEFTPSLSSATALSKPEDVLVLGL